MYLLHMLVLCDCFVLGYADASSNNSGLGTGYQYAYGGGAMKSASHAAKALGPYGGCSASCS